MFSWVSDMCSHNGLYGSSSALLFAVTSASLKREIGPLSSPKHNAAFRWIDRTELWDLIRSSVSWLIGSVGFPPLFPEWKHIQFVQGESPVKLSLHETIITYFAWKIQLKCSKINTFTHFYQQISPESCFSYCFRLIYCQTIHQPPKFLLGKTSCLLRYTGPFEVPFSRRLYSSTKTISLPEEGFETITTSPTEEEQAWRKGSIPNVSLIIAANPSIDFLMSEYPQTM